MLTKRDENLIQRCVDGEMSPEERSELISRLESLPDGWKALACCFMEDQLFADAAVESAGGVMRSVSQSVTSTVGKKRHWFSHPVTSVVLSLCVAFLAGILVSGELNQPGAESVTGVAATETLGGTDGNSPVERNSSVAGSLVSDKPGYSVRFEADGMSPREMPVYNDETDFLTELEVHRLRRQAEMNQDLNRLNSQNSDIHFLRIRLDDGRIIVVPFEGALPRFQ